MTIGGSLYGEGLYGGGDPAVDEDYTPPADPPDLTFEPDAPTPSEDDDPDDPATIVPEVVVEIIERDGTHVAWLDGAKGVGWRRDQSLGNATLKLKRDHPQLTDLQPPNLIRIRYRGKIVQDALIKPLREATVSQGEEGDQFLTITAPGHGAILGDMLVGPWSSTSRPASDSQRFSAAHPDYTMTPGWGDAAELARQDEPTTFWTGLPAKWPAPTAYYVGGGSDSHVNAEPGHLHTRRKFVTETRTYAMLWSGDNFTDMFADGRPQGETRDFQGFQRVDQRFTGGEHTFYCHWENENRETGNPTFFLFALCPIDSAGRLGDPVLVSDSSWKILDRPLNPPGWKINQIIAYLLNKAEARGCQRILRTWDTLTNTDLESSATVPDLTISGTSSVLEALEQIAETYIDWNMRPGLPFTLDVWNKGARGSVRDVTYWSGYNDPESCITSLEHNTEPPYATTIFGQWGTGWLRRFINVPDGEAVERSLRIPNVLTLEEAVDTLDKLLELWGRERIEYVFEIDPRTNEQRPHLSYHVCDLINVEGRDGTLDQVQVQAINGAWDDNNGVTFRIECGDVLLADEELMQAWLERMDAGAFGGRSSQPTSTPVELPRQLVQQEIRPLRFHRPATVVEAESDPDTPEESGRIRAWVATINPTQAFDVDIDLYIAGAPSGVTVTVPAGQAAARVACNIDVQQDADLVSAHCADTGFAVVAKAIFE